MEKIGQCQSRTVPKVANTAFNFQLSNTDPKSKSCSLPRRAPLIKVTSGPRGFGTLHAPMPTWRPSSKVSGRGKPHQRLQLPNQKQRHQQTQETITSSKSKGGWVGKKISTEGVTSAPDRSIACHEFHLSRLRGTSSLFHCSSS